MPSQFLYKTVDLYRNATRVCDSSLDNLLIGEDEQDKEEFIFSKVIKLMDMEILLWTRI